MSEEQNKTFKEDGTRPIASGEMEVADTFKEDGTRPIAESPDFLLQNDRNNTADRDSAADSRNSATQTDSQSSVDSTNEEVVDTFEADGTRPDSQWRDGCSRHF